MFIQCGNTREFGVFIWRIQAVRIFRMVLTHLDLMSKLGGGVLIYVINQFYKSICRFGVNNF